MTVLRLTQGWRRIQLALGLGFPGTGAFHHQAAVGPDLTAKLRLLVKRSWGPREENQSRNFPFDMRLVTAGGADLFAAALLKHIRFVAPHLNVPFMTPRIEVSELKNACGQFVEEDGWVKLVLSKEFALDPAASCAILCHELCHYVLFANGIRLADREDNERLTDVAMFVFGIGDIFLGGFKSKKIYSKRYGDKHGHRVGYLTDDEYRRLNREVLRLRTTGELQIQNESELHGKLLNRLDGNKPMLERYLTNARQRFPTKSESEQIQAILDDFDRGR